VAARLDAAVARTLATDHVLSVATWVGYVTTTLVIGSLVAQRLAIRRPNVVPMRTAVAAGLAAAAVALPLRAAEISGAGLGAFADRDVAAHVLTSAFGGAIALRAGGLLLIAAKTIGRLAGVAVLASSYLVIGHPQATDPVALEVSALAVHLLAAATWFGGLVVLAREMGPRRRRAPLPAAAVSRFSRLAEAMVVLVIGSGLVLAEGQNVLTTAPWSTGYGTAFTAKLAFVAVVMVIGGWNRQFVVPAIARRDDAAARRHLRATCLVEVSVISMGVLLMTAAMTSGGF
jgi:putative copper export protein